MQTWQTRAGPGPCSRNNSSWHATRAAVEEGVVPGGGTALVRAINAIKTSKLKGDNHDQDIGIQIALRAMEEPLRQIVENAGEEGSVVFHKVADSKDSNYGYNAASGEYGDMLKGNSEQVPMSNALTPPQRTFVQGEQE